MIFSYIKVIGFLMRSPHPCRVADCMVDGFYEHFFRNKFELFCIYIGIALIMLFIDLYM